MVGFESKKRLKETLQNIQISGSEDMAIRTLVLCADTKDKIRR